MNIQDKRAGRSERGRVAEPKQQVAVTEIRACGGERGGSGEGIRAVDMQICVVHLLGEMVMVKDMVEFGEPESFIANHGAAAGKVVVPAQEVRHALSGNVRTVESIVSMVSRRKAVYVVGTRLGNDVDDAPGGMAELGFVASGEDLEFSDGILIELGGSATIEFVLVSQTIDEEPRVVGALAKHGRGVVAI